jgi:RIO-like serine/threonine protein kinase
MRAQNRRVEGVPQAVEILKRDALGRIELVRHADALAVRRVACGSRWPLSRTLARILLVRERRALDALAGIAGVARVLGREPRDAALLRSFVPGTPLCLATELPRDYFERLEELVRALHARGVCHNDLHKEANVLVGADGYPALVDFQLASVHPHGGRIFASRAREDLRHVWKHRSHYLRALGERDPLGATPPRRSLVAEAWRRVGKPLYNAVTRSALVRARRSAGEARRLATDPLPRWTAPVGPRAVTAAGSSPGAPSRAR